MKGLTVAIPRYTAFGALQLVCCVLVLITGCDSEPTVRAGPSPHGASGVAPSASSAPTTATIDPLAGIRAKVSGGRLTEPVSVRADVTVSAVAAGYTPRVAATDVMARYFDQDGLRVSGRDTEQWVFLAALTDSIPVTHVGTPVWVVAYHHADVATPRGTTVSGNVISFLDAQTGKLLYTIQDTLTQPVRSVDASATR